MLKYKRVVSITRRSKSVPTYDIHIDDKLHNFILSNGLISHNSGTGVRGLQYAMHNIERTLRFAEINFMFVYVVERHHSIHTLFYTRGEHYVVPPFGDYAVLGVLQPLVTQQEYQLLGLMTVDLPSQKIIDVYHKKKAEFVGGMQKSAGFGAPADILRDYAWLLAALANDKKFLALPNDTIRADYVSYKFHIQKNVVQMLLSLVDLENRG
jgi:hypothetical protein